MLAMNQCECIMISTLLADYFALRKGTIPINQISATGIIRTCHVKGKLIAWTVAIPRTCKPRSWQTVYLKFILFFKFI